MSDAQNCSYLPNEIPIFVKHLIFRPDAHNREKDISGTSFVINHNDQVLLITARHLLPNTKDKQSINILIYHSSGSYARVDCVVNYHQNDKIDIAVLSSTGITIESAIKLVPGEPVYTIGFPAVNYLRDHSGNPVPVVKQLNYAGQFDQNKGVRKLMFDGFATEGGSGGPILICQNEVWKLLGIVKSNIYEEQELTRIGEQKIVQKVNVGITSGFGVNYLADILNSM